MLKTPGARTTVLRFDGPKHDLATSNFIYLPWVRVLTDLQACIIFSRVTLAYLRCELWYLTKKLHRNRVTWGRNQRH